MPIAPDLVGHALDGRYELRELIGEGTFGRVYRGYDRRLAREVAIKVIKPWWAEHPDWADSFEREAQLLARVSDPGIVQIYDVGQAEEGLYYVTELVDGESLAARLRRAGRLAPWTACEIAEQLCRALEHAHAEQIVHRDIKPGNVLLSSRGRVKVGDLGIARLAEGTTEGGTATIVGTPRYMSPEQANGLPVTPATDVYSAGIVLYEMLAGHPPFNGDSAVEIALRHVQAPPPPLPAGTPWPLEEIVERALAKEAAGRYQTAGEMADALAAARAKAGAPGPPASARRAPENGVEPTWVAPKFSPRRNVNPAARRRAIGAFGLALALLVGLAVAAMLLTGRATVRLARLEGLAKPTATARLNRAHLKAEFSGRYSSAAPGTVVDQTPRAGTRVKQGSTVLVVLSRGPRPIEVPSVTRQSENAATGRLHRLNLTVKVTPVPAPGTTPGIVVGQSPSAGHHLHPHATVALSVAEVPKWQSVTSFSGSGSGQSAPFHIRGTQWRVVYTMTYQGTCDFVFFCYGPSAHVIGIGSANPTDTSFDLSDGGTQTRVFKTGTGRYQIAIKPGLDSARWSIEVDDWY